MSGQPREAQRREGPQLPATRASPMCAHVRAERPDPSWALGQQHRTTDPPAAVQLPKSLSSPRRGVRIDLNPIIIISFEADSRQAKLASVVQFRVFAVRRRNPPCVLAAQCSMFGAGLRPRRPRDRRSPAPVPRVGRPSCHVPPFLVFPATLSSPRKDVRNDLNAIMITSFEHVRSQAKLASVVQFRVSGFTCLMFGRPGLRASPPAATVGLPHPCLASAFPSCHVAPFLFFPATLSSPRKDVRNDLNAIMIIFFEYVRRQAKLASLVQFCVFAVRRHRRGSSPTGFRTCTSPIKIENPKSKIKEGLPHPCLASAAPRAAYPRVWFSRPPCQVPERTSEMT